MLYRLSQLLNGFKAWHNDLFSREDQVGNRRPVDHRQLFPVCRCPVILLRNFAKVLALLNRVYMRIVREQSCTPQELVFAVDAQQNGGHDKDKK